MLTVREAMMIAADLKLGYDLTKAQKVEVASIAVATDHCLCDVSWVILRFNFVCRLKKFWICCDSARRAIRWAIDCRAVNASGFQLHASWSTIRRYFSSTSQRRKWLDCIRNVFGVQLIESILNAIFSCSGLDDLSSSQCVALLRRIAHGGRTVICSVHTPSAKIFEMFDHVYVLAEGQCVYQGKGENIVPYTQSMGLSCPLTYNPVDFSEC